MTWEQLQQEISDWAKRNFGEQGAWQPMLGLIEEVGEFLHARDRHSHEDMVDALGDQTIYVLNLAQICGVQFNEIADVYSTKMFDLTTDELLSTFAQASHAILKHEQGIRNMTIDRRRIILNSTLTHWFNWVIARTMVHRTAPILEITWKVWKNVRQRDWTKNPDSAHLVAQ